MARVYSFETGEEILQPSAHESKTGRIKGPIRAALGRLSLAQKSVPKEEITVSDEEGINRAIRLQLALQQITVDYRSSNSDATELEILEVSQMAKEALEALTPDEQLCVREYIQSLDNTTEGSK